jgi:predicted DNA-binding transcriptional regulator YafY
LEQILISEEVEVTIKKIEAMVSSRPQKRSIQLSFYDWEGRSEIYQILKICNESILKERLVSFDYIDKEGIITKRIVEPYQLHFSEMSWYLRGFCLDRMKYRTFKLSRTENLSMINKNFTPRKSSLDKEGKVTYQPQLTTIKALISPSIKDHFIERYGRNSIEAYNSELFLTTIDVPQNNIGFQFLASFGTNLEILEPETYVKDYLNYLNKMIENYS